MRFLPKFEAFTFIARRKKIGKPKQRVCHIPGVQQCSNFKVKWLKFRNLCMLYKSMNPKMDNQTVLDLITGRLKMLASVNAINEAVAEDIAKFGLKRKRNAAKF